MQKSWPSLAGALPARTSSKVDLPTPLRPTRATRSAGARVIEQTIRQSLPEGFQTSEFLLQKGFLDLVVKRPELKETVARCLRHLVA